MAVHDSIMPYLCKKKILTSKIKQGYKYGHGSHLYQVLYEWHILASRTQIKTCHILQFKHTFLIYSIAFNLRKYMT